MGCRGPGRRERREETEFVPGVNGQGEPREPRGREGLQRAKLGREYRVAASLLLGFLVGLSPLEALYLPRLLMGMTVRVAWSCDGYGGRLRMKGLAVRDAGFFCCLRPPAHLRLFVRRSSPSLGI